MIHIKNIFETIKRKKVVLMMETVLDLKKTRF